jgi:hypothetical protein
LLGAVLGIGEPELGEHGVLRVREAALDEAEVLRRGHPVLGVELLQALLVVLLRRHRILDGATALAATAGRGDHEAKCHDDCCQRELVGNH